MSIWLGKHYMPTDMGGKSVKVGGNTPINLFTFICVRISLQCQGPFFKKKKHHLDGQSDYLEKLLG